MFAAIRRWVLFALAVALLASLAVWLGDWQFQRLEERRLKNDHTAANLVADPVPVGEVLDPERRLAKSDEWRRVRVSGTWDAEHTIVVRYRTRDGEPGVDVVTPLRPESGPAVLVDRGWLATANTGSQRPDLPQVSEEPVTVVGWARPDSEGSAARLENLSTRAVSSEQAEAVLGYPLYRGFIEMESADPPPAQPLTPTEPPDTTSDGPHFFYGLQWWFFAALAIAGFIALAVKDFAAFRRRRESSPQ